MPLYNVKVSATRTVNTSWESEAVDADAAFAGAHKFASNLWPDADNIEVSIEPIKVIDTE